MHALSIGRESRALERLDVPTTVACMSATTITATFTGRR
jgi:hypothetical protein